MKGGIAVMLAALKAVEASEAASGVGYEVVINSDEEVGSPASAALLAQAARGKRAALTYEPAALPDGTLAGARPGSGNFSFTIRGRSAHAGRNPEDGRNADWLTHQGGKVSRGLAALEAAPPLFPSHPRIGEIALACTLGYLDLRFGGAWRATHPKLVAWLDDFAARVPAFEATRFKG